MKATTMFDAFTTILQDITASTVSDVDDDGDGVDNQQDRSESKFNSKKATWQERPVKTTVNQLCTTVQHECARGH